MESPIMELTERMEEVARGVEDKVHRYVVDNRVSRVLATGPYPGTHVAFSPLPAPPGGRWVQLHIARASPPDGHRHFLGYTAPAWLFHIGIGPPGRR